MNNTINRTPIDLRNPLQVQIENYTVDFLEAVKSGDHAKQIDIKSKSQALQEYMTNQNALASGKPLKVEQAKSERTSYEFSQVIGVGYCSTFSWEYSTYKGKVKQHTKTAHGLFLGFVKFKMNGFEITGSAVQMLENCLDLTCNSIYGFNLGSMRDLKVVENVPNQKELETMIKKYSEQLEEVKAVNQGIRDVS